MLWQKGFKSSSSAFLCVYAKDNRGINHAVKNNLHKICYLGLPWCLPFFCISSVFYFIFFRHKVRKENFDGFS